VAEQYLKKGAKVYIEGQLQTRIWTDQAGVEKYSTEVVLQKYRGELTMLDGKGDGGGRSYDDGDSFGSSSGKKRVSDGPRESFNQDLDDEIPF
jgi:single-strand DNA-binding protein